MRTDIDYLVLDNFLLLKKDQPVWEKDEEWQNEFTLD
jgi:carbamoyltransferase